MSCLVKGVKFRNVSLHRAGCRHSLCQTTYMWKRFDRRTSCSTEALTFNSAESFLHLRWTDCFFSTSQRAFVSGGKPLSMLLECPPPPPAPPQSPPSQHTFTFRPTCWATDRRTLNVSRSRWPVTIPPNGIKVLLLHHRDLRVPQ